MAAYPFQPLIEKEFKKSSLIRTFKKDVDAQKLRKDYDLPDRIIIRIIRSASDKSDNHSKTDNP